MDRSVFVILLITAPLSSGMNMPLDPTDPPQVYYFIETRMNWDDAHEYCIREHTAMAQIYNMDDVTEMLNARPEGFTGKAWIGLFENVSEWTWSDGQPATYFNWRTAEPSDPDQHCVIFNDAGRWKNVNCLDQRRFICSGDNGFTAHKRTLTWNDAQTACEESGDVLAIIPNKSANAQVKSLTFGGAGVVWIGLHRTKLWFWSEPGENSMFTNWQEGQPDNVNGPIGCGAAVLEDGTWTDEPCDETYPFFCSGVYKTRKTVVKMTIESSKNLEDPVYSAELLRQIRTALGNQGVTDFKLTWKKHPVKQERRETKDTC